MATDFDGDFVQLDSGAVVAIENDIPTNNTVTLGTQTVYEDGLNNGQSTGTGGWPHGGDGDVYGGAACDAGECGR